MDCKNPFKISPLIEQLMVRSAQNLAAFTLFRKKNLDCHGWKKSISI